jgi:predicted HicB family RNase H-like nuclease
MMEVAEVVREPVQEERVQRVRELASDKFRDGPDWVTFYREVLGANGVIDGLFPGQELRAKFEKTAEFEEIQHMLAKLREKNRGQKLPDEATRVITVRLPKSLHEALRHEAHNHKTSMNKLCISKLLQVIDGELVPSDFERPDGEDVSERRRQVRAKASAAPVADQPASALPAPPPPLPIATAPMPSFVPSALTPHSPLPLATAPTAGAF